jgi:hypothetical protein
MFGAIPPPWLNQVQGEVSHYYGKKRNALQTLHTTSLYTILIFAVTDRPHAYTNILHLLFVAQYVHCAYEYHFPMEHTFWQHS